MFGHKHLIGDGLVYLKGGGIWKMLRNKKQNIGGKKAKVQMDKKKEERLLMKPKLTIRMNENKISIFTKYMKHCFTDAFKPKMVHSPSIYLDEM